MSREKRLKSKSAVQSPRNEISETSEPVEVPLYERIADAVKLIPEGEVATYGQIAALVGTGPRIVGQALSAIDDDEVPWQRVVNSKGQLSLPGESGQRQRRLLREEGVLVQADERFEGRLNLSVYVWAGPD